MDQEFPPTPPAASATWIDLLRRRAAGAGRPAPPSPPAGGRADLPLGSQALAARARAIAARLQRRQAAGERALLLSPPGLDYLAAFFGCLYAGVVAVPVHL